MTRPPEETKEVARSFHRDGVLVTESELREDLRCGTCGRLLVGVVCGVCSSQYKEKRPPTGRPESRRIRETTTRQREVVTERRFQEVMYEPEIMVDEDFYRFFEAEGIAPAYGRFLREGLRLGDGALGKSGAATAITWLHAQFPRSQRDRRLRRTLNKVQSTATAIVERPRSREPTPTMLRDLELALRKCYDAKDKRCIGLGPALPCDALQLPKVLDRSYAKLPDIAQFTYHCKKKSHFIPAQFDLPHKELEVHHPLDDLIADLTALEINY